MAENTDPASGVEAPLPVADALRDASTVVVALHGVGEQQAPSFESAVQIGAASLWGDDFTVTRLSLADLPTFSQAEGLLFREPSKPLAVAITARAQRHVVLPVIWSGTRVRAVRHVNRMRPDALIVALPLMASICWDVLRSVPRARWPWQIGAACLGLLPGLILAGLVIANFYLLVHVPFWFGGPFYHWYMVPLVLLSGYLQGVLASAIAGAFDLIGDVAHYVSAAARRRENLDRFREIVTFVANSAPPRATIVVAGHSLGSVLVTQGLAGLTAAYAGRGRTLLVTMGSPLGIMSRVFGPEIGSPRALASALAASGGLVKWVNLWRDQDFVGRALDAEGEPVFVQASLGVGGHAGYWGDSRVWITLAGLLRMLPAGDLGAAARRWPGVPLSPREEDQFRRLWARRGTGRDLAMMLFPITLLFLALGYYRGLVQVLPLGVQAGLCTGLAVALAVAGWVAVTLRAAARPQETERMMLHRLAYFAPLGHRIAAAAAVAAGAMWLWSAAQSGLDFGLG